MKESMIQNLKVGDSFKALSGGTREEDNRYTHVYKEWIVDEIYPYHVVCICSQTNERESFCYGELVQMGLEKSAQYEPKELTGRHWFME